MAHESELRKACLQAEEALGENLQWLGDSLAIMGRQKDGAARLEQLNAAWVRLAKALNT